MLGIPPSVGVVIVSHNSQEDLPPLLAAVKGKGVRVVVVDSGSTDSSVAVARACGADAVLANRENVGFSVGCNIGAAALDTDVVAFVNPDARPSATDLGQLAAQVTPVHPVWSPRFVNLDGTDQHHYMRFPRALSGLFCFTSGGSRIDKLFGEPLMRRRHYGYRASAQQRVDMASAAVLVADRALFLEVGGFDPRMWLFFSDTRLHRVLADRGTPGRVDWTVRVAHRGQGSLAGLDPSWTAAVFLADYAAYARATYSWWGRAMTLGGLALLGGLVPAASRLARGEPRQARRVLHVVRLILAGGSGAAIPDRRG